MKLLQQIEAILTKYNLADGEAPAAEEATVSERKLEDGNSIFSDGDFADGSSVFVVNEEGEHIPLPTGEYVMDDGSTLSVEDGMVAEAEAEEEVEEEVAAEEEEDDYNEEEEEMEDEEDEEMEDEEEEEEEMTKEEDEEMEDEEEEMFSKQLYNRQEVQALVRKVVKDVAKEHRMEVAALKKRITNQKRQLRRAGTKPVRRAKLRHQEDPTKQYEPKAMGAAFDIFNQYK
ncbi:MAG: hypothetical protein Unbinned1529contig1001_14 [Prokaryotic dsDNA virus sp.]|nr:MAG: hypothetical protein Unbinned1529contig1001_14 [Prokaryotic dsDNA virus sp.]|tara:strand:+ start:2367 stop:3056 length:690 start_codon:yes stop_codon:yes gene_type:complete